MLKRSPVQHEQSLATGSANVFSKYEDLLAGTGPKCILKDMYSTCGGRKVKGNGNRATGFNTELHIQGVLFGVTRALNRLEIVHIWKGIHQNMENKEGSWAL